MSADLGCHDAGARIRRVLMQARALVGLPGGEVARRARRTRWNRPQVGRFPLRRVGVPLRHAQGPRPAILGPGSFQSCSFGALGT
jgi:hypothetical protein